LELFVLKAPPLHLTEKLSSFLHLIFYHHTLCSEGPSCQPSMSGSFALPILSRSVKRYLITSSTTKKVIIPPLFFINVFYSNPSIFILVNSQATKKPGRYSRPGFRYLLKCLLHLRLSRPRSFEGIYFLHAAIEQIIADRMNCHCFGESTPCP